MTARDEVRALLLEDEEGTLTVERRRALEAALEDPSLRRILVEHYAISAALSEHLRAVRDNQRRLGDAFATRSPGRGRRRLIIAAVTASVAAAVWWAAKPVRPPERLPALSSAVALRGTVARERDGVRTAAASFTELRSGDLVEVPGDGLAVLSGKSITVRLGGGARIRLAPPPDGAAARLVLETGVLMAAVTAAGEPLVVEATHATARVSSGQVTVTRRGAATLFEVTAGAALVSRAGAPATTLSRGSALLADASGLTPEPSSETATLALREAGGAEQPPTDRPLQLLRRAPPALLRALRGRRGDAAGMVGDNRKAWRCPDDQREGVRNVVTGLALGRTDLVDEGLRVAEATFARQRPEGDFEDGDTVCLAKFAAEVGFAVAMLRETDAERRQVERASALLPSLRRAATRLAEPGQLAELRGRGQGFQSHLYFSAEAFAYAGELLGDEALTRLGTDFQVAALAHARADGALAMRDGTDTGYQGVMLHSLGRLLSRFPDERGKEVQVRGIQWLRGKITADGRVDATGNTQMCADPKLGCPAFDWQQLGWAFLYYGALHDDPAAFTDAERLLAIRKLAPAP